MRAALAAGLLLLPLAACQVEAETQAPVSATSNAPDRANWPEPPRSPPPAAGTPPPASGDFAIRADRDLQDMVAGCPHQFPEQRPRGSNCFGIFPEQCGADRAAVHVGQPLTADRRQAIEAIAPPGGIRFIRPAEPVTDDLRFQRLNVVLDGQGRVDNVDCY